jgi:hypothetical protein
MQLQDIENEILMLGQWPGVNPGGAPSWSNAGQFTQPIVDFAINRAYEVTCARLGGIQLSSVDATLASSANTYSYNFSSFTPTNFSGTMPQIQMVTRFQYQPSGLTYTLEYQPGDRLISWRAFQEFTRDGYLQPFSFGTQPSVAAVNPERTQIWIYPGSAGTGDTMTISFVPVPTASTAIPLLVNETDTPIFPTDAHQAIVYYAMFLLWMKARQPQLATSYYNPNEKLPSLFTDEIMRIKTDWRQTSTGDNIRFRDGRFATAAAGTRI